MLYSFQCKYSLRPTMNVFYPQTCNTNCKTATSGFRTCTILDGECNDGCVDTFFGKQCDGTCSTRCQNQLCTDTSTKCTNGCTQGFYGPACSGECSDNCAGNGNECSTDDGTCTSGCDINYYGSRFVCFGCSIIKVELCIYMSLCCQFLCDKLVFTFECAQLKSEPHERGFYYEDKLENT